MSQERAAVFENIFLINRWGGQESVSGKGSDTGETVGIREGLLLLVQELGIRSLLDAACGDFNWMKLAGLPLDKYIGMDIVPPLIASNVQLYGSPEREFVVGDIVQDALPRVAMILCRDCLNHLTLEDGVKTLQNFKSSGSEYLVATTFPNFKENADLAWTPEGLDTTFETGKWRLLNLSLPPFNLGEPLQTIFETGTGADFGKALGVWKL